MNPINFALRRPITVMVGIIVVLLTAFVAVRPKAFDAAMKHVDLALPLKRMSIDIFPSLNLPVIYVCRPYGGMDPAPMEKPNPVPLRTTSHSTAASWSYFCRISFPLRVSLSRYNSSPCRISNSV